MKVSIDPEFIFYCYPQLGHLSARRKSIHKKEINAEKKAESMIPENKKKRVAGGGGEVREAFLTQTEGCLIQKHYNSKQHEKRIHNCCRLP